MVSHHMLSKEEFSYISSQKSQNSNSSQHRKRIAEKVEKIFKTLRIIQDSKNLTQEYKDELFNPTEISHFINSLTEHNPDNTNAQEINKQEIILDLIQKIFAYYQSRYKNQPILIKEIMKFSQLASDIKETAENERSEDEASIMYRTRGKMPNPPLLMPEQDNWTALCIFCLQYSAIGTKHEAIKHIRHTKNCTWHKEWKRFAKTDKVRVIEQYIKLIPPKNS